MRSKNIANTDSKNFTILNPLPSPKRGLPYAIVSTNVYANEKNPPKKSSITFSNDHPTVDFLFQFK